MNAGNAYSNGGSGWQPVLRISFTGEDFEAVRIAALALGLTPSAFVRMAALKEVPPSARWSRGWAVQQKEAQQLRDHAA
jgi:hypothetical protein